MTSTSRFAAISKAKAANLEEHFRCFHLVGSQPGGEDV